MKNFLEHPRLMVGLLGLWLLFQIFQVMSGGVLLGSDSERYIFSAQQLAQGGEMAPKAAPYLGYIGAVWLFQHALGLGLVGVVCFQLMLSLVSVALAHRILLREAGHTAAGIFLILVLAFSDFVQWHRYVLTDSMSASLVLIGACLIYQAAHIRRLWMYSLTLLVIGFGAMVRPNGWLLFLPLISYWSWIEFKGFQRLLAMVLGVLGLTVLVLLSPQFKTSVDAEKPAQQLLEGRVIWGAKDTYLQMQPKQLGSDGYAGVMEYAIAYPAQTAYLMSKRVLWELAKVRPYYSSVHNIYILVFMIPIYVLMTLACLLCRSRLMYLLMATFSLHLALVAITFSDWDGRFLMHVYPVMAMLAGLGFVQTRHWITSKR